MISVQYGRECVHAALIIIIIPSAPPRTRRLYPKYTKYGGVHFRTPNTK